MTDKQFSKLLNASVGDLESTLDLYASQVSAIVNEALENPGQGAAFWDEVAKKLDVRYTAMQAKFAEWAKEAIPEQYDTFMKEISTVLNQSDTLRSFAKQSFESLVTSQASGQIVASLIQDSIAGFANALTSGRADIDHLLRKTQQFVVDEYLIDKGVADAFQSGNLRNFKKMLAASSPEYKAILDAVADGATIKAGSKHFKPGYYAEMVARTKFHEAQAQAAIMQAKNYGTDLVRVSSHSTTTAICIPHEGKIYSLSGTSKVYPMLQATPPFHPNCQHLLYPEFAAEYGITGVPEKTFETLVDEMVA